MDLLTLFSRDAIDEGVPNPRGRSLANLSIAFACLSFATVTARLSTRYFMNMFMGLDDYLIIPALILALIMAVSFNEEAKNGFGLHTSQVSHYHQVIALKWFFVAQLLYKIASCFVKLSVLFFYLRIFPARYFRITAYVIAGIVVAYSIGSICATIWSCDPIPRSWDKTIPGTCIQIGDVWYSTSVMSIVTDLAIILLPIYQIRKLRLPLSQKLGLCVLFSLGFFVVACTVVRMVVVGPAITAKDTLYYQATSNSWTFLEVNVAIICASLPVLKAPIFRLFGLSDKIHNSSSNKYAQPFSRSNYNAKNMISSPPRIRADDASEEEFILQDVKSVRKTTEVNISYEKNNAGSNESIGGQKEATKPRREF